MKKFLSISLLLISCMNINSQIDEFDALFEKYNQKLVPGAAVLVAVDGKVVWKKCFGFADIEDRIKIVPKTNFRLASVTKQFTAASILILIQKGLCRFDTKLTEVFEDFPEYGKRITIKNLLNHTSGLIDYEDLIPDTAKIQVKDEDVLRMMYGVDSTYFEPGTQFKYSNTGYALLSMVVEKISGRRFANFLEENIFKPLNMINTVAHEEGISIVSNRAFGYERIDSNWVRKDQSITSAVLGDGGIYSNVEDLLNWEQSLYTNTILSTELREKAMKRSELKNKEKINYGFGWHIKTYKGVEIIYHTGSTQGFRNVLYRVPSRKLCIIILTNRNEGEPETLADKIYETYFNQ